MATIRVHVVDRPAELLTAALAGLLPVDRAHDAGAPRRWPTLSSWIVLRQGGLRDDLYRLAGSQGARGWFERPICLFSELPQRWSSDDPTTPSAGAPSAGAPSAGVMSAEGRATLLRTLIRTRSATLFGAPLPADAWIAAIDAFLGELLSEGIDPDAMQSAVRAAHTSSSGELDTDPFPERRDAMLAVLYRDYCERLHSERRTDGRDGLARLARAISHDTAGFGERLGGRRDVRIVGLADLRGGWRPLLAALARSSALDTVTIITTHALALTGIDHAFVRDTTAQRPLFGPRSITRIDAPDAARESEAVGVRVRRLIDGGTSAGRIAVIARTARPAVDDMCEALDRLGVPVTARRRIALASSAPAHALRALVEGAVAGWSLRALMAVLEHPVIGISLDTFTARALLLAPAWRNSSDVIDDVERVLRAEGEMLDVHTKDVASQSTAALRALLDRLGSLDGSRPLTQWYAWVIDVLGSDVWRADTMSASECSARDAIAALAASWRESLAAFGDPDESCTAAVFLPRLEAILAGDYIDQPETAFGVVVDEALSAGWRAFEHVFLVGLTGDAFPARPAPSALLAPSDRRRLIAAGLALDPPDSWRAREDALFRVLCAAPDASLTLSWPAVDDEGLDLVCSAYLGDLPVAGAEVSVSVIASHELLTDGFPTVPLADAETIIAHIARVASIERGRTLAPTLYNGGLERSAVIDALRTRFGAEHQWSPSSLEDLAKCGWQWMAKRVLRLQDPSAATDLIEPTVSGRILHRALDLFFAEARRRTGAPVFLRMADASWVTALLHDVFDRAWNAIGEDAWMGATEFRALMHAELRAQLETYLQAEMAWNEDSFNNRMGASRSIRTGAAHGELAFDRVRIVSGESSFLLRGVIDRVDVGVDERVDGAPGYVAAIDYKSSKGSAPAAGSKRGWDDGVVLQVPLYAEVVRQLHPDAQLARVEYRTLRSPEIVHRVSPIGLSALGKKKERSIEPHELEASRLRSAIAAAAARIAAVQAGELPASPAPSCGCSPFCPALDVCRIPGGPRVAKQ